MSDYILQGIRPSSQGGLRTNFLEFDFAPSNACVVSRRIPYPNSVLIYQSRGVGEPVQIERDEAAITLSLIDAIAKKAKPSSLVHAKALEAARKGSSLTTIKRVSAFLGQICIECNNFQIAEENLRYRNPARLLDVYGNTLRKALSKEDIANGKEAIDLAKELVEGGPEAIANVCMAFKNGNGDAASGDGWRYRGRGHKQLTGKSNYEFYGRKIGKDLVKDPDLALEPSVSALIAVAFWEDLGCSKDADKDDHVALTKKINGPKKLKLDERKAAAKKIERLMIAEKEKLQIKSGLTLPSTLDAHGLSPPQKSAK